jgi:cystathionine beta-lyase/cystathionine gamma-synthase
MSEFRKDLSLPNDDPANGEQRELSRSTRAVHVPSPGDVRGRPVSVPIYQTSVFAHDDPEELTASLNDPRGGFGYSRNGNPTVRALEQAIAGLEGAVGAIATSSGMGAIGVALGPQLKVGSRILVQESIYGGTTGLLRDLVNRWQVDVVQVRGDDPAALATVLGNGGAQVLYLETISNPMTAVSDIPGMAAVAKNAGVITVVDNTFASPMLCRPLEFGADIVVHSTTKYLNGHSDVTGGVVAYADEGQFRAGWSEAITTGVTPDPFAAWLTLRGLQTLPLRMRQACANAVVLADKLGGHPAVEAVHHPSRTAHPQHSLAGRMLDAFGAMLSFDLKGGQDAARSFLSAVRLIAQAPSLGGVETLTVHPAGSSHRAFTDEQLAAAGISRGTVRISTGIEDAADIWSDLQQALDSVS